MAEVHERIEVAASPDAVWAVGGDLGAIAAWIPAVAQCRLEGDLRHITLAGGGGEVVERIVSRSEDARTYAYEFVEGAFPFAYYQSNFTVQAEGDGSSVHWRARLAHEDPAQSGELADGIAASYRASLAALKHRVEAS